MPQDVSAPEILTVEGENTTRHTVTFATPLTSAQQPSLFTTHHVPEDQAGAAKEAIRQAGIMMEQLKTIRDASQAAYDASSALQRNVQVSRPPFVLLGYATKNFSFLEFIVVTHWVCRFKLRVSGGTLSAPAGCSPQG